MNDLTLVSFGAFMISTTIFMRRAGYAWMAAGLIGFFSPLAFIFLFAGLILLFSSLVGRLGISEERLPHDVLVVLVKGFIVVMWCIVGFLLTRRATSQEPPQSGS